MNHEDHVALIRGAVTARNGVWADFGSGTGAFTLALAELLGPGGQIYSIDRSATSLREQEKVMRVRFPSVRVQYIVADFTHPLDLPPLDGIVMANALHFLKKKDETVRMLREYLRPGGHLILVEYNTDSGNRWVPYPLSYVSWKELTERNGLRETRLLHTRPSRFLGEIYSAVSVS